MVGKKKKKQDIAKGLKEDLESIKLVLEFLEREEIKESQEYEKGKKGLKEDVINKIKNIIQELEQDKKKASKDFKKAYPHLNVNVGLDENLQGLLEDLTQLENLLSGEIEALEEGNVNKVKEMISKVNNFEQNVKEEVEEEISELEQASAQGKGERGVFEQLEKLKKKEKDGELKKMIDKKVIKERNVDAIDKHGNTALMYASWFGNKDIVEVLINGGASPNLQAVNGKTALVKATEKGYQEFVKLLLNAWADPNLQDNVGRTALMYASEDGNEEIVKVLLNARADPNLQTNKGDTALSIADNKRIADLLRSYDAKTPEELRGE